MLIISTPVLIRYLWHLKTIVFLRWCLLRTIYSIELWGTYFGFFYICNDEFQHLFSGALYNQWKCINCCVALQDSFVSSYFFQLCLVLLMANTTFGFKRSSKIYKSKCLSGNDIEQAANTYKINAWNKALIKTNKPNLSN